MKQFFSGRGGRASLSVALTVIVLAAVLLLNVLVSALTANGLWFIDMTGYSRTTSQGTTVYETYTLTDDVVTLLDTTFSELNATRQNKGEEPVAVDLIFCDDPDNLLGSDYQRIIYLCALQLQKAFPDTVSVKYLDIYKNPSVLQQYKSNAYTTIYPTTVIVSSGTEYRRLTPKSFFFEDSTTGELWASRAEVNFAAAIRAVTKAAAPKCLLLSGHGESGYSDALISLLEDAGYDVLRDFDLATSDIPADCRLILCVDPVQDFDGWREVNAGHATVSEIEKLDRFLDDENSFMVFFNADTPVLPNLEEYLETWGTAICRASDASGEQYNYLVRDPIGALSADEQTLMGQYAPYGLGASMTDELQKQSYPPKVIFRDAVALQMSALYRTDFATSGDDESEVTYTYGYYSSNGASRRLFDIFTTPDGCVAYAGGEMVTDENGNTDQVSYSLLTISQEQSTSAGDINGYTLVYHDSNVIVGGSTDMLCDELLSTNAYGNADMLAGMLRTLGVDPMSALIENYIKPFASTAVGDDVISMARKRNTALTLCLIPAILLAGAGIFVMTRRKYL